MIKLNDIADLDKPKAASKQSEMAKKIAGYNANSSYFSALKRYNAYICELLKIEPCSIIFDPFPCFFVYENTLYYNNYLSTVTKRTFVKFLSSHNFLIANSGIKLQISAEKLNELKRSLVITEFFNSLKELLLIRKGNLNFQQLVQVYKIKSKLKKSIFDMHPLPIKLFDNNILFPSGDNYYYLSERTIAKFNEQYHERLTVSPLCRKIIRELIKVNADETVSSVNLNSFVQYSYSPKKAFAFSPSFRGLDNGVIQFFYNITGGSVNVFNQLAMLAARVLSPDAALKGITIIHTAQPTLFIYFLSCITKIPIGNLTANTTPLHKFNEKRMQKTWSTIAGIPFNLSTNYNNLNDKPDTFVNACLDGKPFKLSDPLLGRLTMTYCTHFIHITDERPDIAAVKSRCAADVIRLPEVSDDYTPLKSLAVYSWFQEEFVRYGRLLLSNQSTEINTPQAMTEDVLIDKFISEYCTVQSGSSIVASVLFEEYQTYVKENGCASRIRKNFVEYVKFRFKEKVKYEKHHPTTKLNAKHFIGLHFDSEKFENRCLPTPPAEPDDVVLGYDKFCGYLQEVHK